jgi:hypothetical protein
MRRRKGTDYYISILNKAIAKKEAIITKKTIKAAKLSYIIILRVKNSILASLGSYKVIEVEKSGILIIIAL